MFELPLQFKSFKDTIEIKVTSGLSFQFSIPSASQHDWSSLYADKLSMGSSSHVRFYRRCILAACCTHVNGKPLAEMLTDEKYKKVASALLISNFSDIKAEDILEFYEVVLSHLIGSIPENLLEIAYSKFNEWVKEKTFELMPLSDEAEQIENDSIRSLLENTNRGPL